MKKMFTCFLLALFGKCASAQNVGIGLNTGIDARLHVAKPDSGLAVFQNTTASNDSVKSRLYFKTGGSFTGAIGTHIEDGNNGSTPYARLGFFTFASANSSQLRERLSITDGGNVGIGTVAPTAMLDVAGTFRIRGGSPGAGKVLTSDANGNASWQTSSFSLPFAGTTNGAIDAFSVTNTANSLNNFTAIKGIAINGVVGETTSGSGFGVTGTSSSSGTGVKGISSSGRGISGSSITGSAVYGQATSTGGICGHFEAFNGSKALVTSGPIQLTGLGAAAGKVLTSDANGNATWQANPVFLAYMQSGDLIINTTTKTIPLVTNLSGTLDPDNAFNDVTYEYVIPSAGIYRFYGSCTFENSNNTSTEVYVRIVVSTAGGSERLAYGKFSTIPAGSLLPGIESVAVEHLFNVSAGEKIKLTVRKNNGNDVLLKANTFGPTYLDGTKVR